jgi:AcrR family transcriptional regulator
MAASDRLADRRRRLLDAALDLLADGGAAAVTVTGVCKGAGLTARYFYEHFENREALLEALLAEEAEAAIASILEATTSAPPDPRARAVAGVTAVLDAFDSDPRRAALGHGASDDDLLVLTRVKVAGRMADEFAAHVALVLPGADRDPRTALAAPVIINGVLQIVLGWLNGQTSLTREQVIELSVDYTFATAGVLLA